jgi:hypothetical protein
MMPRALISYRVALLALGMALTLTVGAATSTPVGRTNAPAAGTNAALAEATIPQSVFAVPGQGGQGRDPFFPKSIRLDRVTSTTQTNRPAAPTGAVKLSGLSGTPERPLAIINGVTFGNGDESNVLVGTTRVRLVCIEVRLKDETVLVEIAGERKELRMRSK